MNMAQALRPLTKALGSCAATFRLWDRSNGHPSELPVEVKRFLRRRFVVSEEQVDALRYVSQSGWLNGERVVHLRIFDPNMATGRGLSAVTFDNIKNDFEMVLFGGHISKDHGLHLTRWSKPDAEAARPGVFSDSSMSF